MCVRPSWPMDRHANPLDLFSCVLMVTTPKKSIWKLKLMMYSIWGCRDLGSSCTVRSERLGRKRGNYCWGYNNELLAAARRPPILRRVSSRRWGRVHETGASWADDFRGSSSLRGTSVPLSLNILQETAPAVQACVCVHGECPCVFKQQNEILGLHTLACPHKCIINCWGEAPGGMKRLGKVVHIRARLHDEKQKRSH